MEHFHPFCYNLIGKVNFLQKGMIETLQSDYTINLLKLQDDNFEIFSVENIIENNSSKVVIHIRYKKRLEKCIYCQSTKLLSKGIKTRTINHSKVVGHLCLLKYYQRRYVCINCNKTMNEVTNFLPPRIKNSNILKQNVLIECKEVCSFQSIANKYNISINTVIKIFKENVSMIRLPLPEVIGIDEFKATTSNSKYCFIIKDILGDEIVDILKSRRQDDIEAYLASISKEERTHVKYIVMDLWKPYRTIFRFWFPHACIIADRFHYTRLINDRFNHIRINIMKQIKNQYDNEQDYFKKRELDIDYYYLKKYWKIIMEYDVGQENSRIYSHKLKKVITKFDILDRVLNLNEKLLEAYILRNKFITITKTSTIETIEAKLKKWFIEVKNSIVREYDIAINTMKSWVKEIINSFIIHPTTGKAITNASTEGTNNFCKVIKRVSYGYKDFELLRARILYCNRKTIRLKSPSIKDELNY